MTPCMYEMFYRSTFVTATVAIIAATMISEARSSHSGPCNAYDGDHDFRCSSGKSIYSVTGHHDNDKEDRIYCYGCRYSGTSAYCYQTGFVNDWDSRVSVQCKSNYFIAGVESYHDNDKEDRRFNYQCCRNYNRCTRNCRWRGPVNNFDEDMNYHVKANHVIVGAYSWHRNDKEWVYSTVATHICVCHFIAIAMP